MRTENTPPNFLAKRTNKISKPKGFLEYLTSTTLTKGYSYIYNDKKKTAGTEYS